MGNDTLNILIVVDMQNDFTYGSLANQSTVDTIPAIVEKVEKYLKDDNGKIIFTKDMHFDYYLESEEGKHLPIKHCIFGTEGWDLVDPLKRIVDNNTIQDKIIQVPKSSFGATKLKDAIYRSSTQLLYSKINIEMVGTCTSLCVIANAFMAKAAAPDAHIIIDAKCCSDVNEENHNNALKVMENAHMEIINWER
jgi:nicotinamidase-related amidase